MDNPLSTSPSRTRSALVLVGLIFVVFAVAAIGGYATSASVSTWYPTLAKPTWTPPPWLFGPAWTVLYTAMAFVAWRVWRLPASADRLALLHRWWLQLALNAAWSWAFFYFQSPPAGLLVIGTLLLLIGVMQPRLARLDRVSALLWTPYVLWVTFASCLNLWIWHHN